MQGHWENHKLKIKSNFLFNIHSMCKRKRNFAGKRIVMRLQGVIFIIAIVLAGVGHAPAQVVSSLTEQNLKIPRYNKPVKKPSKSKVDDAQVDIDTTTTYFKLIDTAQVYIKGQDWSKAESYIMKAIINEPSNPNNSLLISNLATLQWHQGKLQEAVKNYSLALDLTPNAIALLSNRAALYVKIDSIEKAKADYRKIVKLEPSNEEARFNLGMIELGEKHFKEADAQFEEILRYNPGSALASKGKAFLNKGTGNYEKAAQYFSDIIKVNPSASLLANRADCYLMTRRLNDASIDIANAIELTPDDGYLYLLRAKLKKMRWEEEDAKKDVQLAIEHGVDPTDAQAALQ